MTAKLVRIPHFTEVPYPVQMEPHLVVEFYSRKGRAHPLWGETCQASGAGTANGAFFVRDRIRVDCFATRSGRGSFLHAGPFP